MDDVLLAVESSDALVARLVAFCDRHDVEQKYQAFYRRHAEQFFGVDTDDDEEKSHAVHLLFQEYEQLFEEIIQDFLDAEELSGEAFFKHCRRLLQSPRYEDASTNLRIVLSALDFHAFCNLMAQEAIQTQQALKAAEDMGL
ncbi:hypothetical protein Gpo141_00000698 [Globisporangium polare]